MMPVALKIRFVKEHLPTALAAGIAFNMNPNVLLAQAALESGWGQSDLACEANNLFALSAYGCSNEYWHGSKATLVTANYALDFRRYDTRGNSFMDFARLIRSRYRTAWQASAYPAAYVKELVYNGYLSDGGVERETYRSSLIQLEHEVRAIEAMLGEA